jgi:ADP-ribose pyrophosphatase YjhB (NUDIX family)
MVQRKHSLGYMEFMRGKYDIINKEQINHLLEQMTPNEIHELNIKNFDYLWNMLWEGKSKTGIVIKNNYYYKEYISSKQKFYELKMTNNNIFDVNKSKFNFNEWGFPKGRRETYETDIVCAMREFEEETNNNENEYTILDEINIIKENLIGTNGVKYRHNYYLAIIKNNKINNNKENNEIADTKFMNIDECINVIRPYHNSKQQIVKKIHDLIVNFMIDNF